ncbi:hypothetical protein [Aquilutibacter rugosus]
MSSALISQTECNVLLYEVMAFGRFLHRLTDEFPSIIHPTQLWRTTLLHEMVQDLHNAASGKAGTHLNAQRLAIEVVKHVKGTEPASQSECSTNKIQTTCD